MKEKLHSLKEICSYYNTSSYLILPILNNLIDTKSCYFFTQLLYPHGFINSFLYNEDYDKPNHIHLLFYKDLVTEDLRKTFLSDCMYEKRYGLDSLMIDSSLFANVEEYGDKVMFSFRLPRHLMRDIKLIEETKYSEVSPRYKDLLRIKVTDMDLIDSDRQFNPMDSTIAYNLAYYIVTKNVNLKEKVMEAYNVQEEVLEGTELFKFFNKDKELFKNEYKSDDT